LTPARDGAKRRLAEGAGAAVNGGLALNCGRWEIFSPNPLIELALAIGAKFLLL
jgi:hypothetical protein